MIALRSFVLLFVLHALWQVPLLLAAGCGLSRIAGKARPELQYRLWIAVLLAQVLLPGLSATAPGAAELWLTARSWLGASATSGGVSHITSTLGAGRVHGSILIPPLLGTLLLACYIVLTSFRLARLVQGCWKVRHLRRSARVAIMQPDAWTEWATCCALFGVRVVTLAETTQSVGPITIGARRKLVLVPAGLLQTLTAEDRRAAFAHECAHMQRNDFTWNLLLHCAALPITFHPLVQGSLNRIAEAREMICDERAAAALAGRQRYAKSLLRLAAALLSAPPPSTSHVIGMLDANTLERRLMRLQKNFSTLGRKRMVAMVLTAVATLAGTWTTASALHLGVGAPVGQAQPASYVPFRVSGGEIAGNVLTQVQPNYPQEARDAKLSGTVVMKAIISETGIISSLEVLSGPAALRQSSLDAIRQWTYKPYILNGQPTAVETTITVNYDLK